MRPGNATYATKLPRLSAKNAERSSVTSTLDSVALVENISAPSVSPLRVSLTRVLSATAARNSAPLWLRDRARNLFVLESVLSLDPIERSWDRLSCRWDMVQRGFGPFQPSNRILMSANVIHQV